jgi:hypothetical protein
MFGNIDMQKYGNISLEDFGELWKKGQNNFLYALVVVNKVVWYLVVFSGL